MSVVLVVDSEGAVTKNAFDAFAVSGHYAVIERRTAGSALSALREGIEIDIAIIADRLEDMDGMELLGSIRKLAPELPVIMTSRNTSVESYLKAISGGAYELIEMPVRPALLRRIAIAAIEEPALSRHYRPGSHLRGRTGHGRPAA